MGITPHAMFFLLLWRGVSRFLTDFLYMGWLLNVRLAFSYASLATLRLLSFFFFSFFLVTAGSITSGAHIAAPVRSWTKNEQRGADVGRASPALAEGSARVKIRDGFLGMRRS